MSCPNAALRHALGRNGVARPSDVERLRKKGVAKHVSEPPERPPQASPHIYKLRTIARPADLHSRIMPAVFRVSRNCFDIDAANNPALRYFDLNDSKCGAPQQAARRAIGLGYTVERV